MISGTTMSKRSTAKKPNFYIQIPIVSYIKWKHRIHTKICWPIKLRTISANIHEIVHTTMPKIRKWLENSKMNAMEFQLPNSWDFVQRCIRFYSLLDLKFERQKEFREQ